MNKNKIIHNELIKWKEQGKIDDQLYNSLSMEYSDNNDKFHNIMKSTLILGCILLALGIISSLGLMVRSIEYILLTLTALTIVGFYVGFFLNSHKKSKYYYPKTGNALISFSCLIMAADIFLFMSEKFRQDYIYPRTLLIVTILYFFIAYFFKNTLVLIFGIIGFFSWLGCETGYISGWGSYFLGLNYPIRFLFISLIVLFIGYLHNFIKFNISDSFKKSYYSSGLLFMNLSLWVMSIFGNYGSLYSWRRADKIELLLFSLIWLVLDIILFFVGVNKNINMFRKYAVTFIIINLYTRYFEYFWNRMHFSIFFIILGLLSLGIGIFAEKKLKKLS